MVLHRSYSVGSLFAGIGGMDLGLEDTGGFHTEWFCEQDEFCQRVLARHWPGVPCYPDITELHHPPYVDVLCGGFPCQDLSYAGLGAGLSGARSGLWTEYARLIGEVGPRYVIVENVSALLARGLGVVLGDLAALGYDAEWDCIPASAVGAPHRRDRIWLVAYPARDVQAGAAEGWSKRERARPGRESGGTLADTTSARLESPGLPGRPALSSAAVADAHGMAGATARSLEGGRAALRGPGQEQRALGRRGPSRDAWLSEPDVGRVADGVPARVDRLRALGNTLIPQIAEWIGGRILAHEAEIGAVAA